MPSASELLNSIQETIGLKKKKPTKASVVPETPAAPAPESAPESVSVVPADDRLPDWLSAPSAVEPTPTPTPESAVAPAATPDWLKDGEAAAEELWPSAPAAPLPEPEAPVVEMPAVEAPVAPSVELHASVVPAAEAPVASPAVEAEKSPEQLAIEQFEEALIAADDALGWLRAGETLDNNQLRVAMAATATANGLIRNLPERYLKVLLASRRLGENRDYNRLDFQKDMLAAIRVFSQANKG